MEDLLAALLEGLFQGLVEGLGALFKTISDRRDQRDEAERLESMKSDLRWK
jgi:hypothetical protein